MVKRVTFYAAFVFLIAVFMTAGCAKLDVVKKDDGITTSPGAKKVDAPKPAETKASAVPSRQASAPSAVQAKPLPASAQQSQNMSSLASIYFDFDSAGLSESARSTLTKNAALVAKEGAANIRIEGNCDERGSDEYNLALGERRAKAALQYLVTMGIKPDRLSIISYGKEKPAVQGGNEAAWAKNRRDEFVVVTK